MAGVFCSEQQDRAGAARAEVPQARDASGDRDREVQRQNGFAALWLAADDADGLLAPQRVHQPLLLTRPLLQLDRGAGREAEHGRSSSSACCRWSALTVLASTSTPVVGRRRAAGLRPHPRRSRKASRAARESREARPQARQAHAQEPRYQHVGTSQPLSVGLDI